MAGSALGMAFYLLLLASITKVLTEVGVPHYEMIEAVVGHSVTLPCTIVGMPDLKLVNIEWSKKNEENENTKLAVYSPNYGLHLHWPNVTIKTEKNDISKSFSLYLPVVTKWDSGSYICDIASFPHGSLRSEIKLKIKDVDKIMCDVNSTVEAQYGENVTIHCRAFPNAQYRWTKSKKLVSEKESLELWQVTDEHAGIYTLTVNTGDKSLHKEFNIIVLTVTTSLRTDLVTVSPRSNVTREGFISSTDTSLTTSQTTDTSVTWTVSTVIDVTDGTPNSSNNTTTAGESITSFTNDTHINITSSPATHADSYYLLNSTTLSYGSTLSRSAQEMGSDEMRNESTPHTVNPDHIFPFRTEESSTLGNFTENLQNSAKNAIVVKDNIRSHLLVPIIISVMVLLVVIGFLYRRHIINQRMALPPPFKPPPPPVKYTAARQCEISTKSFPISRCDSVTEFTTNV